MENLQQKQLEELIKGKNEILSRIMDIENNIRIFQNEITSLGLQEKRIVDKIDQLIANKPM